MVVRRGQDDQSILPMAGHFRHSGHVLRFTEYMDAGATNGWRLAEVVPAEIVSLIGGQWPIEPVAPTYHGDVARRYRDGAGEAGVIAAVTQPFCRGCSLARLSAEGNTPVCGHRARPARSAARRRQRPGAAPADRRDSGPDVPTATPSCARCRPSARTR